MVFEVGGRGKGREQFKGIKATRKIVLAHAPETRAGACPLFLLGYLPSFQSAG